MRPWSLKLCAGEREQFQSSPFLKGLGLSPQEDLQRVHSKTLAAWNVGAATSTQPPLAPATLSAPWWRSSSPSEALGGGGGAWAGGGPPCLVLGSSEELRLQPLPSQRLPLSQPC